MNHQPSNEYDENIQIVLIRDENIYGEVLQLGAHASLIRYEIDGRVTDVWMENDDFILLENIILKHEEYE